MRLQGVVFDFEDTLLDGAGQPRPGVERFLSLMKMEDVWMYLVTDTDRAVAQKALDSSDLARYFRGMIVSSEHGTVITDPELYDKAVRRLRTARQATVVFTARDSVLRAVTGAGFQAVLIQSNPSQESRALAAEVISDYQTMTQQ